MNFAPNLRAQARIERAPPRTSQPASQPADRPIDRFALTSGPHSSCSCPPLDSLVLPQLFTFQLARLGWPGKRAEHNEGRANEILTKQFHGLLAPPITRIVCIRFPSPLRPEPFGCPLGPATATTTTLGAALARNGARAREEVAALHALPLYATRPTRLINFCSCSCCGRARQTFCSNCHVVVANKFKLAHWPEREGPHTGERSSSGVSRSLTQKKLSRANNNVPTSPASGCRIGASGGGGVASAKKARNY